MAKPTADEMVDRALMRVSEVTQSYPSSRGPMYQRIGHRQRQLFARAAKLNPERFGACATADLQTVAGARVCDLSDIAAPVATPELIQRIEVANAGTSPYAVGDEIVVVGVEDLAADLPPRALLRDQVLIGVSTDLDLVTTIKIYYGKLPDLFLYSDGAKAIELEAPWDTLLELDLARWIVGKATQIAKEVRDVKAAELTAEEGMLLPEFDAHVASYGPVVSRFAAPRIVSRG